MGFFSNTQKLCVSFTLTADIHTSKQVQTQVFNLQIPYLLIQTWAAMLSALRLYFIDLFQTFEMHVLDGTFYILIS